MFGIGIQEFGIIVVVALLVFGPKRLPELARTLGRGLGEFRRASNDLRQSLALDDLEKDLRKDLHSAGSILKPENPATRPAQAGDELDTKSTAAATAASDAGPPAPHPGELPLDNDHEHHPDPDASLEVSADSSEAGAAGAAGAAGDSANAAPSTSIETENELGAVPVAGSTPPPSPPSMKKRSDAKRD